MYNIYTTNNLRLQQDLPQMIILYILYIIYIENFYMNTHIYF
jgi:hypothetical protein